MFIKSESLLSERASEGIWKRARERAKGEQSNSRSQTRTKSEQEWRRRVGRAVSAYRAPGAERYPDCIRDHQDWLGWRPEQRRIG